MNPRLVEPGFVVVYAYTWTSPLVPVRTRTARTTRRHRDDMGRGMVLGRGGAAQVQRANCVNGRDRGNLMRAK
jgi:hypothetical protein